MLPTSAVSSTRGPSTIARTAGDRVVRTPARRAASRLSIKRADGNRAATRARAGPSTRVDRLERRLVHDGRVVQRRQRRRPDLPRHQRDEHGGVALAGARSAGRLGERQEQARGLRPLLGREHTVPRGNREPVRARGPWGSASTSDAELGNVAAIRRTRKSCCASFSPKYARHGPATSNSRCTTVSTPAKCPGRARPSERRTHRARVGSRQLHAGRVHLLAAVAPTRRPRRARRRRPRSADSSRG